MIHGPITLQEVDQTYRRMGLNELVVIPFYEGEILAGMTTGFIHKYPAFPGLSGLLEHFIVLPEAQNKLRVMQQMPRLAATLLAGKVERILLCIAHDERRRGLGAWARRCGFTKFGELDSFDWYVKPLTGEPNGKVSSEDAGSSGHESAAAATPGP
jgi:hypothetical protein